MWLSHYLSCLCPYSNSHQFPDEALNVFFGGFLLTLNQADRMLQQVRQQHQMHHRVKRKILPYDLFPQSKWTMPVYYQFDGSHGRRYLKSQKDYFCDIKIIIKHFCYFIKNIRFFLNIECYQTMATQLLPNLIYIYDIPAY